MKQLKLILRLALFGALLLTQSLQANEVELADPAANADRYQELINELRCMVCQNQSIADSNSELARDFRNQVKEMLNKDESDEQIRSYMVDRYGDYILYRPPFNPVTALLWLGPFLLMLIGFIFVVRLRRKTAVPNEADEQDKDEQDKKSMLKSMLETPAGDDRE